MSPPAIRVENLGKRYRIGLRERQADTFVEALANFAAAPFRRLRKLREQTEGEDIFWALRDVSFNVQPGEVVGVIGRNGAGKSTLLKILSRITEPTAGRAELRGVVGSLLEVGTGFHPELTGRENIFLNGAILGMKHAEIRRVFDEIVAFSEIERFLDTPVKRYSSGMYVRLAFAVAAHLRPEILIVDEVLAVGDAQFQRKCLGKMGDVARGGRTVLFVSHNMRAVSSLCSRAILLEGGRLIADDEAPGVVEQYLSGVREVGESCSSDVHFTPRDDAVAQVTRVTLRNADEEPAGRFAITEPVSVEVEFVIRQDVPNLVLVMQVRSALDDILWISTDVDHQNRAGGTVRSVFPRKAGVYRARTTLPPDVLNQGEYGLVINLTMPREGAVDSVRGPRFELADVNTFAVAPFQKSRPGMLIMPLNWELRYAEQTDVESTVGEPAAVARVAP